MWIVFIEAWMKVYSIINLINKLPILEMVVSLALSGLETVFFTVVDESGQVWKYLFPTTHQQLGVLCVAHG